MTDWIDAFANGLKEDQRAKNVKYQHDLLRDRLIAERAPVFFGAVVDEIRRQAEELNQKVGGIYRGVNCGSNDDHMVAVTTGDGTVRVECRLNLQARQLTGDTTLREGHPGGGGRVRQFGFNVDTDRATAAWVTCDGKDYRSPSEIATLLLQEAFTGRS